MEPTLEDGEFALVDPENTTYSKNKNLCSYLQ